MSESLRSCVGSLLFVSGLLRASVRQVETCAFFYSGRSLVHPAKPADMRDQSRPLTEQDVEKILFTVIDKEQVTLTDSQRNNYSKKSPGY